MGAVMVDELVAGPESMQEVVIDFLYLDLETCTRCRGTDANLGTALAQVGHALDAAGVDVLVRKTLVASAEQAQALGFVSSPTIRVNGKDIALELRESSCAECGEACGCDGAIDCRVWVWQGEEYTQAPPAMIVDAILRAVYGGMVQETAPLSVVAVPENLARFFAGKAELVAEVASCCSPSEQAACCEPSHKASCCGNATSGGCGCQ
jgi:hypothetical protein